MLSVSFYLWCSCFLATIYESRNLLTPVVKSSAEYENVLQIISMYDNFTHFNNFVLFAEHLDEDKEAIIAPPLQRSVMQILGRPVIIAGNETKSLYNIINTYNLAVVLFSGLKDPILHVVINALETIPQIPILFICKSTDDSLLQSNGIYEFFNWCWTNGFRNLILAFEKYNGRELWSYKMAESIVIYRITESHIKHFKNRHHKMISPYKMRIAVSQNPPYAFLLNSSDHRDITGGKVSLGGQTGIMLAEFVRFVGGTLDIISLSGDAYCTNTSRCRHDKMIDFGANMVINTELVLYSPFVLSTKFCLVVPFERKIPLSKYFKLFFGNPTLVQFSAFYYFINILIRRFTNPRKSLATLIYTSIQLSWGQALPNRIINRMAMPDKILIICTLIYNLLLTTVFSSVLATVFTTGIYMPEIVDVKSFVANDISIMISEAQLKEADKIGNVPSELLDRVLVVDQESLDQHLNSLNDSYVYFMETHRFAQIEFLQERLSRPRLKLASEPLCALDRFLRLPIRQELSFVLVVTRFVEQATEAGLTKKWMQMGLQQLKQTNTIQQAPFDPQTSKALPLPFYIFGFQIYGTGMLLGMMVMLIECINGYWRNRNNNHTNVIII